MAEQDEDRSAERVDRLADQVLRGGRLKATPSDAADHEAILAAASLAGSREPYPRMTPPFKRRLQGLLQGRPEPPGMTRRAALVAGLGVAIAFGQAVHNFVAALDLIVLVLGTTAPFLLLFGGLGFLGWRAWDRRRRAAVGAPGV